MNQKVLRAFVRVTERGGSLLFSLPLTIFWFLLAQFVTQGGLLSIAHV